MKKIPKFKDEEEERDFWSNHDFTDYFDMNNPIEMDLSKLKRSKEKITKRKSQSNANS
ncbi:BrnA antitoxin family protein [Patescibacteria group bacterium]|nr:BrnA antitoxin family protein [Patescibacteria group bacterium]